MTYEEWLVEECGTNHGWSFSEKATGKKAWDASRREALLEAAEWFAQDYNFGNPVFVLKKMAEEIK
jgi:hypothetical protein